MTQSQEVIARAYALQGLVREEAPQAEQQGTLTAPVVQALLDAELFSLMVPATLEGLDVDGRTYLEVVEAIAAADESVIKIVIHSTFGYTPLPEIRERRSYKWTTNCVLLSRKWR